MSELFGQSLVAFLSLTILSYCLGSISFGILLARLFNLGNLREIGSGNIGTTNVLRTGNYWAAGLTLLLDFAKGLIPILVAINILDDTIQLQIVALAPFMGHLFPIWHKFKGGKGVATYFGIVFGISFTSGLICAVIWLACAFVSRFASLSALISVLFFPIGLYLLGVIDFLPLAVIIAIMVWLSHLSNLKRLFAGKESKIKLNG